MTAEDLINTGVSVSYVNRPDTLALAATELLGVLNREMEDLLHKGYRTNPWYFAVTSPVTYNAGLGGWSLPSHEIILKCELASTGESVSVLSLHERQLTADDLPKLYYVRGVLQRAPLATTATVATNATVNVLYIPPVGRLTATSQSPDSYLLPERHQNYLSYKIAVYLAAKDGRDDDQSRFDAEAGRYLARYLEFLAEHSSGLVRFWTPGQMVTSPAMSAVN